MAYCKVSTVLSTYRCVEGEKKPTTSEIWVTLFTPYYTYNRVKHEHNNHTHFACTSLKNLTTLNIEWLHKICNQNFKEQRFEQKQILKIWNSKTKKKTWKTWTSLNWTIIDVDLAKWNIFMWTLVPVLILTFIEFQLPMN